MKNLNRNYFCEFRNRFLRNNLEEKISTSIDKGNLPRNGTAKEIEGIGKIADGVLAKVKNGLEMGMLNDFKKNFSNGDGQMLEPIEVNKKMHVIDLTSMGTRLPNRTEIDYLKRIPETFKLRIKWTEFPLELADKCEELMAPDVISLQGISFPNLKSLSTKGEFMITIDKFPSLERVEISPKKKIEDLKYLKNSSAVDTSKATSFTEYETFKHIDATSHLRTKVISEKGWFKEFNTEKSYIGIDGVLVEYPINPNLAPFNQI